MAEQAERQVIVAVGRMSEHPPGSTTTSDLIRDTLRAIDSIPADHPRADTIAVPVESMEALLRHADRLRGRGIMRRAAGVAAGVLVALLVVGRWLVVPLAIMLVAGLTLMFAGCGGLPDLPSADDSSTGEGETSGSTSPSGPGMVVGSSEDSGPQAPPRSSPEGGACAV